MTLLAFDPIFLEHNMPGHPECADRLTSIIQHLRKTDLWDKLQAIHLREATDQELALVHSKEHIENIRSVCKSGDGWIDSDTYVLANSFSIAKLAAGAVLSAIENIASGAGETAFCAVRPPGHHATRDHAMGFCLFNNVAIGARFIQKQGWGERILIVDWDVHHGNGTQDIFWDDPTVGYFSVHRSPFYPGSGSIHDKGGGEGAGTTFNLPLSHFLTDDKVLSMAEAMIREAAEKIRPDWILISCGFDAYAQDPIGGLGFNAESYAVLTRIVMDLAGKFSQGRVVSVLEGGYALDVLGTLTEAHLRELMK